MPCVRGQTVKVKNFRYVRLSRYQSHAAINRASQDTFSAATILLKNWASTLASFASHTAYIRECLKAVRAREETLNDMYRRMKSLVPKADSAEKKLDKMNPDNKNLRQQTDLLVSLREQIRTLNVGITNEEASLGDYKRGKAKEWMSVLFGALLECSEKGTIVASFGRTIIGQIPTDKTQPGIQRAKYVGNPQVESLLVGAERELSKISFVNEASNTTLPAPSESHTGDTLGLLPLYPGSVRSTFGHPPPLYGSSTLPASPLGGHSRELSELGENNTYPQSRTYTPGLQSQRSSPDQPSGVSPTMPTPFSSHSLTQGGPGFTPDHVSYLSGSGFVPGYIHPAAGSTLNSPMSPNNAFVSGFMPEVMSSTEDPPSSPTIGALRTVRIAEEKTDAEFEGQRTEETPGIQPSTNGHSEKGTSEQAGGVVGREAKTGSWLGFRFPLTKSPEPRLPGTDTQKG